MENTSKLLHSLKELLGMAKKMKLLFCAGLLGKRTESGNHIAEGSYGIEKKIGLSISYRVFRELNYAISLQELQKYHQIFNPIRPIKP